jgi:cytochrome c-type biogenesis protein CcmH/NrfF
MRRFQRLALVLALCCSAALMMGADVDKTHEEKARYQRVGDKMQCMCGCNQMLLKCNHVGCQVSTPMIRDLKVQLNAKTGDEEVLDWFRQNYGVTAVILPASHGFELTAWVVPPVILMLAIGLALVLIVTWKKRSPATAAVGNARIDPKLESLRDRARRETEL